jgi:universal stress protein A
MNPDPIKVLLCATDFSPSSDRALEAAVDLARRYGLSKMYLLHVAEVVERGLGPGEIDADWMLQWNRFEEVKAVQTRKLAEQTARAHGIEVIPDFRTGGTWREIVGAARELRADVLVLGSHGRTGLARVLMGSVAEQVVRHAPCTVVVVRPDDVDG